MLSPGRHQKHALSQIVPVVMVSARTVAGVNSTNAINAFKDDGLKVVAWPYLTDTNAFYLLAEPTKHNIRTYWRERPNVLHDWDFETSSMKVKIRSRWKRGWSDWRGVYATSGSS